MATTTNATETAAKAEACSATLSTTETSETATEITSANFLTEVKSCCSDLTTEGTDTSSLSSYSTIKSNTVSRDTELGKSGMERVTRSPGNFSLGRHGVGFVISGKAGMVGVAGSSGDGSLSRHGV